ncbi:MAG: MOSC domain-containing protein [Ginsengibacter sp.]
MLAVSKIFIYPIKSLGGVSLLSAKVTDRGLEYDRRWMLIDDDNKFISQRECPKMSQIKIELEDHHLKVYHQNHFKNVLNVPFDNSLNKKAQVMIWDDECTAEFVSKECDEWFSEMLQINCRLVYMPSTTRRLVEHKYAVNKINNFSDAFPVSIISNQSLVLLNSKLSVDIAMDRFRPNIVFDGPYPHYEDQFKKFIINNISFEAVKLIARCMITTIDQTTSLKGKEPLKTLSSYRSTDHKIYFGNCLISNGTGEINIGSTIIEE